MCSCTTENTLCLHYKDFRLMMLRKKLLFVMRILGNLTMKFFGKKCGVLIVQEGGVYSNHLYRYG